MELLVVGGDKRHAALCELAQANGFNLTLAGARLACDEHGTAGQSALRRTSRRGGTAYALCKGGARACAAA